MQNELSTIGSYPGNPQIYRTAHINTNSKSSLSPHQSTALPACRETLLSPTLKISSSVQFYIQQDGNHEPKILWTVLSLYSKAYLWYAESRFAIAREMVWDELYMFVYSVHVRLRNGSRTVYYAQWQCNVGYPSSPPSKRNMKLSAVVSRRHIQLVRALLSRDQLACTVGRRFLLATRNGASLVVWCSSAHLGPHRCYLPEG